MKKNPISCCVSVSHDDLFIHRTESKAWFIVAVFFACQEIWRDNLVPVTQRYSRVQTVKYKGQLNLKTQRPRLEAAHVAEWVRLLLPGTYSHAALRGSTGGPARQDEKAHEEETNHNKHIHFCVTQVATGYKVSLLPLKLPMGKIVCQPLKVLQAAAKKNWLSHLWMWSERFSCFSVFHFSTNALLCWSNLCCMNGFRVDWEVLLRSQCCLLHYCSSAALETAANPNYTGVKWMEHSRSPVSAVKSMKLKLKLNLSRGSNAQ